MSKEELIRLILTDKEAFTASKTGALDLSEAELIAQDIKDIDFSNIDFSGASF